MGLVDRAQSPDIETCASRRQRTFTVEDQPGPSAILNSGRDSRGLGGDRRTLPAPTLPAQPQTYTVSSHSIQMEQEI